MTSFRQLIREIHRRSLWQVLAIYLAGSWVAFEVVGEVTEAAALPEWVPGFALVLLIIGLPIVVATAFVQEGVDALSGGREEMPGPGVVPEAPAAGATRRHRVFTWRNAILGGVAAFALLGVVTTVSMALRATRSGAEPTIDPEVILVPPFRATGTDVQYLREGMIDLIAAQLTGEGGPAALDARTTLKAWEAAAGRSGDLTEEETVALARSVGAGSVLLGNVVQSGRTITINARLVPAIGAGPEARARATGSPDSLSWVVDRLVGELLARHAGFDADRVDAMTGRPAPAVRAYLDGMADYRAGRFADAAIAFRRALTEDSTFALSGLMLANALGWEGRGPEYELGLEAAWNGRERLPPLERALIEALIGPEYPDRLPRPERLKATRTAAERWPRSPEAWYKLGDVYFHYGDDLGVLNAWQAADSAFERALDIDSMFAPALTHALESAAIRGDTAGTRAYLRRMYPDSADRYAATRARAWLAAAALSDERWQDSLWARVRDDPEQAGLAAIYIRGRGRYEELASEIFRRLGARFPFTAAFNLASAGRPGEAIGLLSEVPPPRVELDELLVAGGYASEFSSPSARAAVPGLLERAEAPDADDPAMLFCFAALWFASEGDVAGARRAAADMRARRPEAASDVDTRGPEADDERVARDRCRMAVDLEFAVEAGDSALRASTELADSILDYEPYVPAGTEMLATAVARAWAVLGEMERARSAAVRIRSRNTLTAGSLLMEARYAARAGDIDGAIRAYQRYLAMRFDPEPEEAEIVDQARAELSALLAERG